MSFGECDYILYITCAGVGPAIESEVEGIGELIAFCQHENKKLILVGCLTRLQNIFKEIKKMKNVIVIENDNWIVPVMNCLKNENKRNSINTILANKTMYICNYLASVQLFIQKGCINRCSFCKSNYADMTVESLHLEKLLDYLHLLIKNGVKSITLS